MSLFERREPTGKWWIDHSLSIVLGAILSVQTGLSLWAGHEVWMAEELPVGFGVWWFHEYNLSLVADTFGVVLIVMLSKWFYERGSSESK